MSELNYFLMGWIVGIITSLMVVLVIKRFI